MYFKINRKKLKWAISTVNNIPKLTELEDIIDKELAAGAMCPEDAKYVEKLIINQAYEILMGDDE